MRTYKWLYFETAVRLTRLREIRPKRQKLYVHLFQLPFQDDTVAITKTISNDVRQTVSEIITRFS